MRFASTTKVLAKRAQSTTESRSASATYIMGSRQSCNNVHQCHAPDAILCCSQASQLNHSCRPNTVYHFEHCQGQAGPTVVLRSIRAIAPSEPLTISYVNVLAPVEERRPSLRAQYKFDCTCEGCRTELCDQQPPLAGAWPILIMWAFITWRMCTASGSTVHKVQNFNLVGVTEPH